MNYSKKITMSKHPRPIINRAITPFNTVGKLLKNIDK